MLLTPSEHIQQQLFWYGYYEKPVALLLQNLINPNSIILDIGANIGYFTLIAAQRAKIGRVYAFEPVKELFQKLQRNIVENNFQNTELINSAVGESQKDSIIYISSTDNAGMSSLKPPENFSGITQAIKIINIDQWIVQSGIKQVDIIKLDVEGGELFALHGMTEILMNFKPVLIVEINPDTLAYFNLLPMDVMHYLNNLDYLPFTITKNGFLQKTPEIASQENIAFVHREKLKKFNSYFV
jgi:FkbM family methyltransferase